MSDEAKLPAMIDWDRNMVGELMIDGKPYGPSFLPETKQERVAREICEAISRLLASEREKWERERSQP